MPSWVLAKAGLGTEHVRTPGHGNVVTMNAWAGNLEKLAALTGEDYFEMLSRNAILGRFSDYPGYYIDRNLTYEMKENGIRTDRISQMSIGTISRFSWQFWKTTSLIRSRLNRSVILISRQSSKMGTHISRQTNMVRHPENSMMKTICGFGSIVELLKQRKKP